MDIYTTNIFKEQEEFIVISFNKNEVESLLDIDNKNYEKVNKNFQKILKDFSRRL